MKVRVAHIISGLGVGGAERNLVNLLNATACEYRAVACIGRRRQGPTFRHLLDPSVEQLHVAIGRGNLPSGIVKLAAFLRKRRVNVVHTHMYESNLFGSLAAKMAGVPVVITSEHGENPWKRPYQCWIERNVISPIAAKRLCVSPRILERRRDVDGVPADKLHLMVNGTTIPRLVLRNRPGHEITVGAVGRFVEAKDYPGLVCAAALLRDRGFPLKVCILGDGPEAARVSRAVTDLRLESMVELPGMVTDIESWYPRFDVFVSPSVREGLPMVLLEAMAHGLPIVATDVGACAEVVRHGEGGLIVPPGQPAALADALARLIADADLRESLGRGARLRAERHYSVESVAAEHLELYEELLLEVGAGP